METATSTLSVLPSTKEQVQLFADKLKSEITNGEINPLELRLRISAMEKVFDAIKPELTTAARDEAEKYGAKSFTFMGSKFELSETGVKYDFSECGHTDYNRLVSEIEAMSEKKKQLETFMKTIKNSINLIDSEGEAITVYEPKRTSTSGIKVTL